MDCYVTLCYEVDVLFDLYLRHYLSKTLLSMSEWSVRRSIEVSKVLLAKSAKRT